MPMEPWATYRPEINAAAITGAGPLSWFSAAAVWAGQAIQVAETQAIFYGQTAVAGGSTFGLVSAALGASSTPYGAWLAYMQSEAVKNSIANTIVGTAHATAALTMVPLPAVLANRVAAAAAQAAGALSAAAAPAVIQLEQQYATMWVNNGRAMQVYDTAVTTATMPKTYSPPPQLATTPSPPTPPIQTPSADVIRNLADQGQRAIDAAKGQLPMAAQQGQQFATQAMAPSQMVMSQAAMAARPTTGMASQFASRGLSGVSGSGLGSGSRAMTPSLARGGAGGGLPAFSSLGGGGSSLGGRGVPTLSAAGGSALGAMPRGGALGARMPFSGIPLAERAAGSPSGMRGPMGAMPMGAAQQDRRRGSGSDEPTASVEEVAVVDPVAEAQARRTGAAIFR